MIVLNFSFLTYAEVELQDLTVCIRYKTVSCIDDLDLVYYEILNLFHVPKKVFFSYHGNTKTKKTALFHINLPCAKACQKTHTITLKLRFAKSNHNYM